MGASTARNKSHPYSPVAEMANRQVLAVLAFPGTGRDSLDAVPTLN